MPTPKPYHGRPLAELATLPGDAFITTSEYRQWRQISASKYHRDMAAGLIPPPLHAGPQKRLHTMAQARAPFANTTQK